MEYKKITLCLDDEVAEFIINKAERMGITKTELINIILYEYFQSVSQECTQSHDQ